MTTGARLTAALECANDAGGRCALWPSGDAHACYGVSRDTATSCAFAAGAVSAARAALTGTGATPQSEGLVRVRRQVCLRTPAPVPSGSLPANYPYAGRRFSAASRRRITRSPAPCPSGYRTSPSKAGAAMGGAAAHAAKPGMRPSWAPKRPSRMGYLDRSGPLRRVGWGVHIRTLPDAVLGIQRGGSLRSRRQAPERHRRSGDRGATAKQPATYGTAGAHIATVVPCTCTSMSMCTRGTPRTPGDRRSRSAPRAALDTSAKQPSHHSAGLVNREAPARRVIGSGRPERRKARRTRNRPSGEDAFSARSFRRADRAVHHRGGIE